MSHLENSNSPVIKEITGASYYTTKRRRSKSNSRRIRQRQLDLHKINIQNLPEDIALRITSKLTLKEAAQMCVLSSTWRQACVFHPNLCFGVQTVLGSANAELIFTDQRKTILFTNQFIERVEAILKNHCTTQLKTATIGLVLNRTIEYVLTWIPCILPQVDTLCVELWISTKMSGFTHPSTKFIQLRHLTVDITSCSDPNSVFQLAYLLEVAPLLEGLHFNMFDYDSTEYADLDDIMDLPHYHLKTVCINGFLGTNGQVRLAKYILKNALALEHLIVKPGWKCKGSTFTMCELYGRHVANKKLVPLDTNSVLTIM